MTLMDSPVKTELKIVEVNDKRNLSKRFKKLGLTKGSKIQILNKTKNGMIVKCRGVIYGVDRKLALNIICEDE